MKSSPSPGAIHIWIPEYDFIGGGGIQRFSRFLIRAVADCLPDTRLCVYAKNDLSRPSPGPPAQEFLQAGHWPRRMKTAAFTAQILLRALRQRPDLILCAHVHFSPLAVWLKRMTGIRFVALAHGLDVWDGHRPTLPETLRKAERVFAVSQFTRERMCSEMRLDPARTAVLSNTFDSSQFVPGPKPAYLLERFRLRPDQKVLLTISRLSGTERYKGHDQMLRALPAIKRAIPDVHYIIGGRGADHQRLEKLVRQMGLSETVTLAGYIPESELCDHYNLGDVFAMPSKGEGFGIAFLEAMSCGKPVLAGNLDGSVEALLNGELGALVNPNNTDQISDALIRILNREYPLPILYDRDALRKRAIEAYGYERFKASVAQELASLGLINHAGTGPSGR